jgi:Ca-activated chloride channel homolog
MNIETRFDHAVVPVGTSSVVHILITLAAPKVAAGTPRPDLNIAAVIDRSCSMGGEPLEYAKESVGLLLDQLGPNDRFSLVVYGSEVLPLVEGVRTSDHTETKSIVRNIGCEGMTNLSGGWLKGIELVSRDMNSDEVRAVLLLTDGQANEGITNPDKLEQLGKGVNDEQSIRTTCMGLGLRFNEDLLDDIATAAGGRFHYIESPEHAPAVFEEELGGLLEVVAQNVEVDLHVADGVKGIAQRTDYPCKLDGPDCKFVIGDFGSEQVKHLLLSVELPALKDLTDVTVATMGISYAEVGEDSVQIKNVSQELVVSVSDSSEPTPPDPEVLLHIGIQRAAQARKDAIEKIDKKDIKAAVQMLELRRDELKSWADSASQPESLKTEADELDRRAKELRESQDVMESRKFMVAEGSAMSKGNYKNMHSARKRRRQDPGDE